MLNFDKLVKNYYATLHNIPEPAFQEFRTAEFLAAQLQSFGYDVQTSVGGTGVVGTLKSAELGPTVALRADMDCLLHQINGKDTAVHSCGHDGHCAMVLTVAKLIADNQPTSGSFKIIFQPAEETLQGAEAVYRSGIIDDVDYLLGVHLRTKAQAPMGKATAAIYFGGSSVLRAVISGKTAHGARPHLGISAIDAVGAIIYGVNAIHLDPTEAWSVKTTRISAGNSANAICDYAEMYFDLRAQKNELLQELVKKTMDTIKNSAAIVGAQAEVQVVSGVPAAIYYQPLVDVAKNCIIKELGSDQLLPDEITPGGEDFHVYASKKPELKTAYIGIGCDMLPGLHDPSMSFNQDALIDGVKILESIVRTIYKELP